MLAEILHDSIIMGFFGQIAEKVGVDVITDLGMSKEQRREKGKWGFMFAIFALLAMLAFFIQHNSMKGADLLGGHATIERFMRSNIIAMVILLLSAVGFILVCFNTWKGRSGSMFQLIYTIGAGVIIVFSGISIFRSIHNIQKDLDAPKTRTISEYVLCKKGNDCMLAFNEEFGDDSLILVIPQDKYNELRQGELSKKPHQFRAYRLVEESEYVKYTDAQVYITPIEVTYYPYSVIYEDVKTADAQK